MQLSCSRPVSVNSLLKSGPHRRVYSSANATQLCCRNLVPFPPNCTPSSSYTATPTSSCSTSSSWSNVGISLARHGAVSWNTTIPVKNSKRSLFIVCGIFERFTERAINAVMFSQKEAKLLGKDMVCEQHLLLGLIEEDRSPRGFLESGITIDIAREAVQSFPQGGYRSDGNGGGLRQPQIPATEVPFSTGAKRVFEAAVDYSMTMGYKFIAPEHIAIGLFTVDDGSVNRVLKRLGVHVNHLAAVAVSRLKGKLVKEGREPSSPAFRNSRDKLFPEKLTHATREKKAIDVFCVDLTTRASNGSVDPVIGRDTEVHRIIQILCRRTKSNPILLGEAGVGKTAIAEGLATSIADENVPSFLTKKRILSLDVGLLIAGTKERGELEGRVTMLIKEIKKSGNIILFIDEVHTLIDGRGSKGSGLDIANLLKPALGRGEFQCMASTTMDEFRLHFEKDKSLARRFQPVLINEPSKEEAVQILLGLREKYEAHHRCVYTLEAINAAVHVSARYIPDRYLPDKAIDLIDEAGSRARMEAAKSKKEKQVSVLSSSPSDYWKEIRAAQAMHKASLVTKLTEYDDTSRMEEDGKLNSSPYLAPSILDDEISVVGHEDIASVASLWSGIPVNNLTADERMLLVGLEEQLKKRVIGQDEAVSAICRAVKRSRVGLNDPDRPIAVMLFCGPTGVGKTELTKALAATYFGSESAMLRLDMSEYTERHTVGKIIGSPPGYVGYGEGGTLTEAIRRRPFTVVLLDEIEKAHPDIFNILLQLFEDGHLTDSQGRRVSFKNALVVMTSNVGSADIVKGRQNGFGFFTARDDSTSYVAGMQALVTEELKRYFQPELLNRIDEVVVFRPLEKPQMLEILGIMLHEVKERLIPLGISLEVSEAIIDLICQQGYDRTYGARPLRRAVTRIIEDLISESLLSGEYKSGDIAVIHLDDSGNPIVTNKSKQGIQLCDTNPDLHGLNPTA